MKPHVSIQHNDYAEEFNSRFDNLRLPEKIVSAIDCNPFNTKNISLYSKNSIFSNQKQTSRYSANNELIRQYQLNSYEVKQQDNNLVFLFDTIDGDNIFVIINQ